MQMEILSEAVYRLNVHIINTDPTTPVSGISCSIKTPLQELQATTQHANDDFESVRLFTPLNMTH